MTGSEEPVDPGPADPDGTAEIAEVAEVVSSLAELNRSPRIDRLHDLPATERRVAARRLAAVTREIIDLLSATAASAAELNEASDLLDDVAALLAAMPAGGGYEGFAEAANAGDAMARRRQMIADDDPEAWAQFDFSPFIGLANPMSPPLVLSYDGDAIEADVTFGSAYEGPPGCVHGGYVAAAFDEVLGAAQSLSGTQGMTASLRVDYRSPTPLRTPLRIRAWVERRDGRKIWVTGQMHAGDRLCAEAEGLFIAFDPAKFLALLEARERMEAARTGGRVGD